MSLASTARFGLGVILHCNRLALASYFNFIQPITVDASLVRAKG